MLTQHVRWTRTRTPSARPDAHLRADRPPAAAGPAADALPPPSDPVAEALEVREQVRALLVARVEAFDMIANHLGGNHQHVALAAQASRRLPFLVTLLADLAWVLGEHRAHETAMLHDAPESAAVKRAFINHPHTRRQYPLTGDQSAAVLAYLDALTLAARRVVALDDHAPSRRMAAEAGTLAAELGLLRDALTTT